MPNTLYRILCAHCHSFLYWYKGLFEGNFQLLDFAPAQQDVPPPRPGKPMICPKCGQAWYILRQNGSIYVMTNQGWKPRAPDGDAPTTMRTAVRALLPEVPKDMRDGGGDFKEH